MKRFILLGLLFLPSFIQAAGVSEDNWRTCKQSTVTALTSTVSVVNITNTTGVDSRATRVYLSTRGAGTSGFYWDMAYGLTYTATGSLGHYQNVSVTAICIGPFAVGTILLFQSVPGTATSTIFLTFEYQKYGDGK
jgi:hypothetical protein